jgi:hypothetical protein
LHLGEPLEEEEEDDRRSSNDANSCMGIERGSAESRRRKGRKEGRSKTS